MESATIDNILTFRAWLALTASAVLLTVPIVIWAVRSGQFGNQKRAARLPLDEKRGLTPSLGDAVSPQRTASPGSDPLFRVSEVRHEA
jgi:hypothetical protein